MPNPNRPVPHPSKGWAFVTAAGVYLLASIGPTTGAVMGWLERNRRQGMAEIARGDASIAPINILHDPTRCAEDAAEQVRVILRGGRR